MEHYGQGKRKKEEQTIVAVSETKDAEALKPSATTAANRRGNSDRFSQVPVSLGMVTTAMKLKDACSLEGKL